MVGWKRNVTAFGALSALVLAVGCGTKSGDDGAAGGAGAGGATAGGAAIGGSAGKGGAGGSGGLATAGGMGGSTAGASGSSGSACTAIHLADGETGPNGLTQVYKSDSSTAFVDPVGVDGDYAYFSEGFTAASTLARLSFTTGMVEKLGTMNGANATIRHGTVYYASTDATTRKVTILSAPVTDLTQTNTLVADLDTLQQNLLADDDSVYWSENASNGVWSVPLAGGAAKDLASDAQPNGMVLQSNNVYWLDFNTEYLERVPKAGGTPERLTQIFFGGQMASDDTAVYWLDSSENNLNRWVLGAASPTSLVSFDIFDEPDGLVVDSGTVYYALGFGCSVVWKIGGDGSGKAELAQGFDSVGLIGVDATHLYITSMGGVYRVDR